MKLLSGPVSSSYPTYKLDVYEVAVNIYRSGLSLTGTLWLARYVKPFLLDDVCTCLLDLTVHDTYCGTVAQLVQRWTRIRELAVSSPHQYCSQALAILFNPHCPCLSEEREGGREAGREGGREARARPPSLPPSLPHCLPLILFKTL